MSHIGPHSNIFNPSGLWVLVEYLPDIPADSSSIRVIGIYSSYNQARQYLRANRTIQGPFPLPEVSFDIDEW